MSNSNLEKVLFHNSSLPISFGCIECPDKSICGGLQISAGVFDCMSFCQCEDDTNCNYVCPRNEERFVSKVQEIQNFEFNNVDRSASLPLPEFSVVVPLLYHGSKREKRLKTNAVAIKMTDVADYATGQLKYKSKEQLAECFKFDANAKLIITGVDQDRFIEPYWTEAHKGKIIDELCSLSPDLITVPNFSLFLHSPRWDNLHNMKRIAICWSELMSRGLQTSLHLNARTDRDWERWTDFIGEREEVVSVSLEFGTGLARKDRGMWHADKVLALAAQIKRPLNLVIRGGVGHLRRLSSGFSSITLIDSSAFSKTRSRRQLDWQPGQRERWRAIKMEENEFLDELLQFNIDSLATMRTHQAFH